MDQRDYLLVFYRNPSVPHQENKRKAGIRGELENKLKGGEEK